MTPPATETPPTQRRVRGLALLLTSSGVSVTGDGIFLAAAPLAAAALSREPAAVAVVTAAGYAAWPLVGLPAGALVDRWPRRPVMVAADLFRAAVLAGLATLAMTGTLTIPTLAVGVFLVGVGGCFFDPAAQAMIPSVVGREPSALARANGKVWAVDTFGRSLAGPPLGAALFSIGRAAPFLVDGASFLVSAALVSGLPAGEGPARERRPVVAAISEGVRFLAGHAELRALTLGLTAYNLGYNVAYATLVLFALDTLHVSTFGYGLLLATMAVGGVAAGWIAPRIAGRLDARSVYALALAVQAVAWLVVLVSENAWAAGAALAFVGVASTTVSVVGGTARQSLTPDGLLGRVVAASRILGIGAAAVGALLGGALAQVGGLRAPFVGAVALLAGCSLAFALRRRPRS